MVLLESIKYTINKRIEKINNNKCPSCNKKFWFFKNKYKCVSCGKSFCFNCLRAEHEANYLNSDLYNIGGLYCESCFNEKVTPVLLKYRNAVKKSKHVELFPFTYKGKLKISSNSKTIYTDWYENKQETEEELKVSAAFMDCNVVYDIEWSKDTDSEPSENGRGTYYYTIWQAKGVLAIKQ